MGLDTLIVFSPRPHGLLLAAGRLRVLRRVGYEEIEIVEGPRSARDWSRVLKELSERGVEAPIAEVLDVEVDTSMPKTFIESEARLPAETVYHFDHSYESLRLWREMVSAGIVPMIASDSVALAAELLLVSDSDAHEMGIVGAVVERDRAVTDVVGEEGARRLMQVARSIEAIAERPQIAECSSLTELVHRLSNDWSSMKRIRALPSYVETAQRMRVETVSRRAALTVLDEHVELDTALRALDYLAEAMGLDYAALAHPLDRGRGVEGWRIIVYRHWLSQAPSIGRALTLPGLCMRYTHFGGGAVYTVVENRGEALRTASRLLSKMESVREAA